MAHVGPAQGPAQAGLGVAGVQRLDVGGPGLAAGAGVQRGQQQVNARGVQQLFRLGDRESVGDTDQSSNGAKGERREEEGKKK